MNFDFSMQIPEIFDLAHVVLAGLSVLLFILLVSSGRKNPEKRASVDDDQHSMKTKETFPAKAQPQLREIDGEGALQLLSILQQEGRLVDFIREDVSSFSDAEIGAAARVVHKGLRRSFDEHFSVEAIRSEEEGEQVRVEAGFKSEEIQLLGQVRGDAPYTGTLVHQGWRVTDVRLPKVVAGKDCKVLAAAQIEIGG